LVMGWPGLLFSGAGSRVQMPVKRWEIEYIRQVPKLLCYKKSATKEKQSVSLCDARLGIIATAKFHPMPASHAKVRSPSYA